MDCRSIAREIVFWTVRQPRGVFSMPKKSSVVVSNGFNKFSLADGASETYKRGELALFLTGAYPFAGLRRVFQAIGPRSNRKLGRLFARQTSVPDRLVRSFWTAEILHALGVALMPNGGHDDTLRRALAGRLIVLAFQRYARSARRTARPCSASIARSGLASSWARSTRQCSRPAESFLQARPIFRKTWPRCGFLSNTQASQARRGVLRGHVKALQANRRSRAFSVKTAHTFREQALDCGFINHV